MVNEIILYYVARSKKHKKRSYYVAEVMVKGKDKIPPRTGHEGPKGE
jgi:hypothetical protein